MKASLKGEKTLILPIDSPITKYFRNIDNLKIRKQKYTKSKRSAAQFNNKAWHRKQYIFEL